MNKFLSLLALSTIVILSGAADAEARGGRLVKTLMEMDNDEDGRISREEYINFKNKRFTEYDVDGNGVITTDEFNQGAAEKFSVRDKNEDGFLCRKDFKK